jgi:hypothetical protein
MDRDLLRPLLVELFVEELPPKALRPPGWWRPMQP